MILKTPDLTNDNLHCNYNENLALLTAQEIEKTDNDDNIEPSDSDTNLVAEIINPTPTKKKWTNGAIAGIVIALIIIVAVIIVILVYFLAIKKKYKTASIDEDDYSVITI